MFSHESLAQAPDVHRREIYEGPGEPHHGTPPSTPYPHLPLPIVMDTSVRCGCYFTLPSGREAALPLLSVSAQVHIADGKPELALHGDSDGRPTVLARVTLTQHFVNTNRAGVPIETKYVFPVPACSAVCAFEMRTANGKLVVGQVKEAKQAEKEFREAVARNKTTGLLSRAAPDGAHDVRSRRLERLRILCSLCHVSGRNSSRTSNQDYSYGMLTCWKGWNPTDTRHCISISAS